MSNTIFYNIEESLYVNITNRCTNSCTFCIRDTGGLGEGYELWLEREPSLDEIITEFDSLDLSKYKEVVFCGYGEPLIRLDDVLGLSKHIKEKSNLKIRINTNGHANLIHQKDVTPQFKGLIDTVSISLNAKDAKSYVEVCKPEFGETAYQGLLDFAQKCKNYVPEVILSVVETTMSDSDIEKCGEIVHKLGVEFRVRKYSG